MGEYPTRDVSPSCVQQVDVPTGFERGGKLYINGTARRTPTSRGKGITGYSSASDYIFPTPLTHAHLTRSSVSSLCAQTYTRVSTDHALSSELSPTSFYLGSAMSTDSKSVLSAAFIRALRVPTGSYAVPTFMATLLAIPFLAIAWKYPIWSRLSLQQSTSGTAALASEGEQQKLDKKKERPYGGKFAWICFPHLKSHQHSCRLFKHRMDTSVISLSKV